MKIAVLTSISRTKQVLIQPRNIFDGVEYHAFVDNISTIETVWKQHKIGHYSYDKNFEGRRLAKIFKILPELFLPNYDYYFWIDATHEIIVDPKLIIKNIMKDSEIAVFRHPQRNCVYDEAKEIKKINYDSHILIDELVEYLESEQYPKNNGLYELSIILRKNTEKIRNFNATWWELICRFSSRDQISFPYMLDKFKIIPNILHGCANPEYCAYDYYGGNLIIPKINRK